MDKLPVVEVVVEAQVDNSNLDMLGHKLCNIVLGMVLVAVGLSLVVQVLQELLEDQQVLLALVGRLVLVVLLLLIYQVVQVVQVVVLVEQADSRLVNILEHMQLDNLTHILVVFY